MFYFSWLLFFLSVCQSSFLFVCLFVSFFLFVYLSMSVCLSVCFSLVYIFFHIILSHYLSLSLSHTHTDSLSLSLSFSPYHPTLTHPTTSLTYAVAWLRQPRPEPRATPWQDCRRCYAERVGRIQVASDVRPLASTSIVLEEGTVASLAASVF